MIEIFKHFFLLGWVSFGGPAAHIGYFKTTFVEKLKWLNSQEYASLVALSQFLPGPGSSQVCFAIGNQRCGVLGGIAAFIAFTLPSFLIMILIAGLSFHFFDQPFVNALIHSFKLLAVVVVADATISMHRSFCHNAKTNFIALFALITLILFTGIYSQIAVILAAALVGFLFLRTSSNEDNKQDKPSETKGAKKQSIAYFCGFLLLFLVLPLYASNQYVHLFSQFYQAGSLVFGGGHVVLPLLQSLVGDTVGQTSFLTGYAAAQAVPGPMFTFATYLGYLLMPSSPILGASIATIAIFLPGFLLILSFQKSWHQLVQMPRLSGAVMAINASVVGIIAAALYTPIFTSSVNSLMDLVVVLAGGTLLRFFKFSIVKLIISFVLFALAKYLISF